MVIRQMFAILAVLYACLGMAHAQDQGEPAIYPQLGHSKYIFQIAFAPDGKVLASRDSNIIKLWDVASGRVLHTIRGDWIAFSPVGKVLASGSDDQTIKLWDVASGRELRTLNNHTSAAPVVFSPDGKVLASNSGHIIILWDVAGGRELRSLNVTGVFVKSFAFSPDGKQLAAVLDDNTIKRWDVASGRELHALSGHKHWIRDAAFSPDGKVLASSDEHGLGLWDVASGRELRTLSGVEAFAFSPDGKELVSGNVGESITVWDVASGNALSTWSVVEHPRGSNEVTAVAFSPDGKELVSSGDYTRIQLWDAVSGRELRNFSGLTPKVRSVAFSSDGNELATGTFDAIHLWDVASARELRIISGSFGVEVPIAFSPYGELAASGYDSIERWDVASGRELPSLSGAGRALVNSLAYSRDGKMLASGSRDNTVRLWDVADGREPRTLNGHTDGVMSVVAFSPRGNVLASGSRSRENNIKLWDVASGRELRTLNGNFGKVYAVTFSPDGKVLASGGAEIWLWDVATGRDLRHLAGFVNSVAFSPDGKVLAGGDLNGFIKLWDVASGHELRTLTGHTDGVNSVAFSPDGKLLASGSDDGTTRIWDVSSGKERVAFIVFADGSSIAITPEGFFDSSSAAAEEHLNVRVGDRVFGIGSYREKFYRPELVKRALAGESLTQFGTIGGEKLPPVVELVDLPSSTSERTLTVKLRVTDGGGGIGLVRVFLNGSAIIQDDTATPPDGVVMRSYAVPLLNGLNKLRAVAFNADNSAQSNGATAAIAANLPLGGRTLHAVVVGIQEFKNPDYNLKYSVKDAQLFAETLEKYSAPLFQNKPDIKLLTTPDETTRDNLIRTLKGVQSIVGIDDLFVFYAASHGDIVDGEYFLITSNIHSVDRLKADAVSNKDLTALLANIPARKKLVIIDTCHAQALGDALQIAVLTRGMSDSTATTILSRSLGLTVLAATKSDEEAQEGYNDHGLFTYVVADGLQGHEDADQNGIVSAFLLAHYVHDQVPKLALDFFQHDQHPTVNMNGEEFLLTKVK